MPNKDAAPIQSAELIGLLKESVAWIRSSQEPAPSLCASIDAAIAAVPAMPAPAEKVKHIAYFRKASEYGPWIECELSDPNGLRFTSMENQPLGPAIAPELTPSAERGVDYIMEAVQSFADEWRVEPGHFGNRVEALNTKARIRRMLEDDAAKLAAATPAHPIADVSAPTVLLFDVGDRSGFEAYCAKAGGLPITPATDMECWDGRFPATYKNPSTETAWRAWANRPVAPAADVSAPTDEHQGTIECMDAWASDKALPTYSYLRDLAEQYDGVLRNLASALSAGGWNSEGLIDPKTADEKIRWGIEDLMKSRSSVPSTIYEAQRNAAESAIGDELEQLGLVPSSAGAPTNKMAPDYSKALSWQRGYNGDPFIGDKGSPVENLYKEGVAAAAARAAAPVSGPSDALLTTLANEGGMIVSTAALNSVQIAAAQVEKRMFVLGALGFVHIPKSALSRPADDDLWDATLRDRDAYHEWADKLAEGIAKHFGIDIGEHSNQNLPWAEALEYIESLSAAPLSGQAAGGLPIDMILHCPSCGKQHIDAPDAHKRPAFGPGMDVWPWTNPPHRSHLCHGCGHIWRPADVPTNGVAAIQTQGKADSHPHSGQAAQEQAVSGSIRDYSDFREDLERLSEPGLAKAQAKVIRKAIYDTIDARVRNLSGQAVQAKAAWWACDTSDGVQWHPTEAQAKRYSSDGTATGYAVVAPPTAQPLTDADIVSIADKIGLTYNTGRGIKLFAREIERHLSGATPALGEG
jgi:hypothetical protein